MFAWKNFIQRYKNARLAIKQIRRGEWVAKYNDTMFKHFIAKRGKQTLWISNGSFFCEITDDRFNDLYYFGYFWRHYVWWAAARKLRRDADKKLKDKYKVAPVLE